MILTALLVVAALVAVVALAAVLSRWVRDRLLAAAEAVAAWLWTFRLVRWAVGKFLVLALVSIMTVSLQWLAQGIVAVMELNGVTATTAQSAYLVALLQGVPLLWAKQALPDAWPQAAKDLAEAYQHIIDDQLAAAGVTAQQLTAEQKTALLDAIADRMAVRFPPPPQP